MTTGSGTDDKNEEAVHPAFEPEAVYCEDCKMWLNGQEQWWDHLLSKKHKKIATSAPPERPKGEAWATHCSKVGRSVVVADTRAGAGCLVVVTFQWESTKQQTRTHTRHAITHPRTRAWTRARPHARTRPELFLESSCVLPPSH